MSEPLLVESLLYETPGNISALKVSEHHYMHHLPSLGLQDSVRLHSRLPTPSPSVLHPNLSSLAVCSATDPTWGRQTLCQSLWAFPSFSLEAVPHSFLSLESLQASQVLPPHPDHMMKASYFLFPLVLIITLVIVTFRCCTAWEFYYFLVDTLWSIFSCDLPPCCTHSAEAPSEDFQPCH